MGDESSIAVGEYRFQASALNPTRHGAALTGTASIGCGDEKGLTMRIVRTLIAGVITAALAGPVFATGRLADVAIYDRALGRLLPFYRHDGKFYVVGKPGNEYEVRVHNRTGGEILGVVSVDGVNAVSGETADWRQSGYVLAPGQRHDIAGWRKSLQRVAAFFFTRHDNSYAARTGRPDHVGVIGVALFRKKADAPARMDSGAADRQETGAADEASEPSVPGPSALNSRKSGPSEAQLGTGHGRSRYAPVTYTTFERATADPEEIVTVYYDTYRNLVARGVIGQPRVADPFPGRFVPDPPR